MIIICSKELLTHAVQTVQKAVATKSTLPILTGIYLSAKDNQLELQATDYEIGISCKIDAQIEEEGTIVLSGRYFQEVVRKLPGETIEITSSKTDNTIQITSDTSQFNLLSLPAEEFPVLQQIANGNEVSIKDSVLRELIKKTVFACAADEARPIFTGGLLEVKENTIKMVATNTHRLALKKYDYDTNLLSDLIHVIIPAKILVEIARLLITDNLINVTLCCQKNQISFIFNNVYIVSRLIEGQYPDYNKVIPQSFTTKVELPSSHFLDAVERVSLLARDGDYNVIKLQFKKDTVIITSNNPDIGKACETVPALNEGGELEIAFNAKYVTDILKNIDSEKLIFCLNTSLSPACIQPINDNDYLYIITPVRTS